jgi:putative membrane protein
MTTPTIGWILAAIHLMALAIGVAGILGRAVALRGDLTGRDLHRVFVSDGLWGLAALLWISTGLVRALGGFEKGWGYYAGNSWFWHKMGLLALILLLELWPMVTLVRWRIGARRGAPIDVRRATLLSRISMVQAILVVLMVLAATAMARGFGATG